MRAVVCGAGGAMGRLICDLLSQQVVGKVSLDGGNGSVTSFELLGDVGADTVIDFSHHSALPSVLEYAKEHSCALVIGTTGHSQEAKEAIREAAGTLPVFFAGNVSLGIAVLCRLAKEASAAFPEADIEIVETHHTRKVDAPSGTAWMLFDAIRSVRPEAKANCGRSGEGKRTKEEIGIHALRLGSITGIHEVHICTRNQRLVLRHEAQTRDMLAEGAVAAAKFMEGKPAGLYDMESILNG